MDTQSLAMEMAPVLIWQKGKTPDLYRKYWSEPSKGPSKKNLDPEPTYSAWDMLSGEWFILINTRFNWTPFKCRDDEN